MIHLGLDHRDQLADEVEQRVDQDTFNGEANIADTRDVDRSLLAQALQDTYDELQDLQSLAQLVGQGELIDAQRWDRKVGWDARKRRSHRNSGRQGP